MSKDYLNQISKSNTTYIYYYTVKNLKVNPFQ